ncbi:hypothetical protein A9Q97_07270, partial [Rhodospirillales bacterium 47_12_T64]
TGAVIGLTAVQNQGRYGGVDCVGDLIVQFREKDSKFSNPGLVNAGVYALKKKAIGEFLKLLSSLEIDVFSAMAVQGSIRGVELKGFFIDIGLPETLEYSREHLLDHLH